MAESIHSDINPAEKKISSLDILLPCYNPPLGWEKNVIVSVKQIAKACEIGNIKVILVNDGSTTGIGNDSIEMLREGIFPVPFTFLTLPENKGKGHALREAAKTTSGEIQIFTDIDFPYSTESFTAVTKALQGGADIAAGVREENYYEHVPAIRKFISRLFRKVLRIALRLEITDTQAGLKGFNAKGKKLFIQTTIDRFLFDLEFIFLASNARDIHLVPVQVKLRPEVVFSKMNWRILLGEMGNFLKIFLRQIFG